MEIIQAYKFGKAWLAFNQMMANFKQGKTGIYVHPDFVIIDMSTWIKLQKQTKAKPTLIIDEASNVSSQNK